MTPASTPTNEKRPNIAQAIDELRNAHGRIVFNTALIIRLAETEQTANRDMIDVFYDTLFREAVFDDHGAWSLDFKKGN